MLHVNAIIYSGNNEEDIKNLSELASHNLKRVVLYKKSDWSNENNESPYFIEKTIEIKTTWHPTKI